MTNANPNPGPTLSPPTSNTRSNETLPEGVAAVLCLLHVLLAYGNHMLATLEQRAAQRSFATIAQCFGTARLPVIIARLTRGIRRAMALQRVLLAGSASGNDLVATPPAPYKPPAERSSAAAEGSRRESEPPVRPDPEQPADLTIPTLEQLEAEIRNQPIGAVIADICRDLGVSPFRCARHFAKTLHGAITRYGGNHLTLCGEMLKRELDFAAELERTRDPGLDWPPGDLKAIHRIMGFAIGEEPACPFPAPAAAEIAEAVAAPA